jgi:ABC-type bacteriocin/lantibiotic exporter with double-glycine peptidase domain
MFSSFKQQGQQQWQQVFARSRSGGPLQRILAWLFLGLMLFVGLTLLMFMLVLSWILIPIMLFRHRAKVKAWQQRQQAAGAGQQGAQHQVIEGEVIHRRED